MGKDAHFLCLFGDYKSLKSTAAAAGAGCGGGGHYRGPEWGTTCRIGSIIRNSHVPGVSIAAHSTSGSRLVAFWLSL
jgi:hypothetical protein